MQMIGLVCHPDDLSHRLIANDKRSLAFISGILQRWIGRCAILFRLFGSTYGILLER